MLWACLCCEQKSFSSVFKRFWRFSHNIIRSHKVKAILYSYRISGWKTHFSIVLLYLFRSCPNSSTKINQMMWEDGKIMYETLFNPSEISRHKSAPYTTERERWHIVHEKDMYTRYWSYLLVSLYGFARKLNIWSRTQGDWRKIQVVAKDWEERERCCGRVLIRLQAASSG